MELTYRRACNSPRRRSILLFPAVLAAITWLLPSCSALPSVSDLVSGLQLSVPVGRAAVDANWDRLSDQLRVQQQLYLKLRRMAVDADAASTLNDAVDDDDLSLKERALYLNTFLREPLQIVGAEAESALELTVGGVGVGLADVTVGGLRRYTVEAVDVDLLRHRFSYRLMFERLRITGKYQLMHYWWANIGTSSADGEVATGQFDIGLRRVEVNGTGVLDVFDNGTVVPALGHTHTRIEYQEADVDVGRAEGAWGGVFSLLGAAARSSLQLLAPYISQAVAPYTVEPIGDYLARYGAVYVAHLDEHRRQREAAASSSGSSPLDAIDQLVHTLRQQLQEAGYDPLQLPNLQQPLMAAAAVQLELSDGALTGLSRLHRSGQLHVAPGRGAGAALVSLGTGRLAGRYRWTVSSGRYTALRRAGSVHFSVAAVHVQARLRLDRSSSEAPTAWSVITSGSGVSVDDFDVHIGEITVESDGMGDTGLDRLLSVGAQGISRLVKDLVTKAIEVPITSLMKQQLLQMFSGK